MSKWVGKNKMFGKHDSVARENACQSRNLKNSSLQKKRILVFEKISAV